MSDQTNTSDSCGHPCASPQLQLYQAIIFATPVLFASVLVLLFCLLYIRRRRGASIHSPMRGQFFGDSLINTSSLEQGLSKSFRQRLPVVQYDETFLVTGQDTQCTVCLCDYQVNEKLLQLPSCNHFFHIQCIDEWLSKNVTCPICRCCLLIEEDDLLYDETETSTTRNDHRTWEGRVATQAQDEGFVREVEIPSTASSPAGQFSQMSLNMERS